MPCPGNTSSSMPRKPLQEYNLRIGNVDAVLKSIPEGKNADMRNNISHAVCVKDGIGHDVAEDPCMETDNGLLLVCSFLIFFNP